MAGEKVTVTARLKALRGKEEETEKLLRSLVEPTRREAGCINYVLHRCPHDPTLFLFYETWESREHLDRHLQQEHLTSAFARSHELLDGDLEITFWEPVG